MTIANWRTWNWRLIFGVLAALTFEFGSVFEPTRWIAVLLQGMALLALALVLPQRDRR